MVGNVLQRKFVWEVALPEKEPERFGIVASLIILLGFTKYPLFWLSERLSAKCVGWKFSPNDAMARNWLPQSRPSTCSCQLSYSFRKSGGMNSLEFWRRVQAWQVWIESNVRLSKHQVLLWLAEPSFQPRPVNGKGAKRQ